MLSGKHRALFDKPWKAELLLLLVSAIIYLIYFHYIIFNINSSMSSITSDTLKNYYTYAYQIRHGQSPLHFSGMNYPFGEHVVYTDCQPLLCWVLMPMKFAHNHLIGILHALILLSFVITPLLLRRVMLRLSIPEIIAWPCALGLALLSPQFVKMNAGHFALSYTAVIPMGMLLLLRYTNGRKKGALFALVLYNLLLFFLHPYLAFGLCIFSFFTFLIFAFFSADKKRVLLAALLSGALPMIVFKVFMFFTDHHPGRTTEPYGLDVMVENTGTLFSPEFGPFKGLLEAVTPERTPHFEGHTYLGFANILLLLLLPVVLIVCKRRGTVNGVTIAFLATSLLLLFLSFGWHLPVLKWLGIRSASLNQFRAVCRFAWFFYYAFGLFLIKAISSRIIGRQIVNGGIVLYLLLSITEAHFFFNHDKHAFWNWRNLFKESHLSQEENTVLAIIDSVKPQALIPLPLFHGGTELYDRPGSHTSMIPAMLYSYHSGLPIVSMLASRTSIPETEEVIGLINTYKKAPLPKGTTGAPFMLLKTAGQYLPDEDRLLSRSKPLHSADSVDYAVLEARQLRTPVIDSSVIVVESNVSYLNDTTVGFLYAKKAEQRVFHGTITGHMEHVLAIRKNQFPPGRYVVSLFYHYHNRTWQSFVCDLVFTRDQEGGGEWLESKGMKTLSGFYKGFGVFETYLDIEKNKGYTLIMYGRGEAPYRISDLMIRPQGLTVIKTDSSAINNFPRH